MSWAPRSASLELDKCTPQHLTLKCVLRIKLRSSCLILRSKYFPSWTISPWKLLYSQNHSEREEHCLRVMVSLERVGQVSWLAWDVSRYDRGGRGTKSDSELPRLYFPAFHLLSYKKNFHLNSLLPAQISSVWNLLKKKHGNQIPVFYEIPHSMCLVINRNIVDWGCGSGWWSSSLVCISPRTPSLAPNKTGCGCVWSRED